MKVVLELNSVLSERHTGFFTYGAGLLQGMAELSERPELVFFVPQRNLGHAGWLGDLPEKLQARWVASRLKARHLMGLWRYLNYPTLPSLVGEFDLYHSLHQLMPPAGKRPRLLTIHDLRRYRHPEFYPHSKLGPFARAVRTADHFICISRATKNDLQEFFNVPDEKIDVVYHGGAVRLPDEAVIKKDNPEILRQTGVRPGQYFAAFSSYDRRKNLPNIMRAFAIARRDLPPDFKLLIIGREPRDDEFTQLKVELGESLVSLGPVDDFLPLLTGAAALVYASLYEGFGLPILEAMTAGTAVITSNTSSMPEVAGPAALLVDPKEPDSIAGAMRQIVTDATLRDRLIAAGHQRVGEFSWKKAASETMAVYQKLRNVRL